MQLLMTMFAVIAGMLFSLAIAIGVEELIFGQVFRFFHAQQAVAVKAPEKN